jgi:hypothetical protein
MLESIDHAQIRNIMNLFPHVIDVPANLYRLGEIFTENAVFDGSEYELGRYEGLEGLEYYWGRSPIRAEALKKRKLLAHNVVSVFIDEHPDGTVTCMSRCVNVGTDGSATVSCYHDKVRKTEAGWRISERKLMRMVPPTVAINGDKS